MKKIIVYLEDCFNKYQCWPLVLSKIEILAHCVFSMPSLGEIKIFTPG